MQEKKNENKSIVVGKRCIFLWVSKYYTYGLLYYMLKILDNTYDLHIHNVLPEQRRKNGIPKAQIK